MTPIQAGRSDSVPETWCGVRDWVNQAWCLDGRLGRLGHQPSRGATAEVREGNRQGGATGSMHMAPGKESWRGPLSGCPSVLCFLQLGVLKCLTADSRAPSMLSSLGGLQLAKPAALRQAHREGGTGRPRAGPQSACPRPGRSHLPSRAGMPYFCPRKASGVTSGKQRSPRKEGGRWDSSNFTGGSIGQRLIP